MIDIALIDMDLRALEAKVAQLNAQIQDTQDVLLTHIDEVNEIMANFRLEIQKE